MKKSVVILIFIIYAASIMVVGFYGIKIKVRDEKIMVEDIICENLDEFHGVDCSISDDEDFKVLYDRDGVDYYASSLYNDDFAENGFVIIVKFYVLPRTATVKNVEYLFEKQEEINAYTIVDNSDGTATITIYKPCSVRFSVRPVDKASDAIKRVRIDIVNL